MTEDGQGDVADVERGWAHPLLRLGPEQGAEHLGRPLGGAARQVTQFRDGRVLWPSISYDGRTLVFERDFGIWALDVASGQARQVQITRRGAPAGPATERLTLTTGIQEMALSPDGKKVAFVVRGEVFSAASKEGGDATG